MLQVVSPPPPTESPQAPALIVLGVYLRGLRKANHGHGLVTSLGLFPSYETGSRAANTVSAGLCEALSACSREETYELLARAADAMERRTAA